MSSLKALWKRYPYRTKRKFAMVAVEHGFSKAAAERFVEEQVTHDVKYTEQREMYLPIYSDTGDAYQFDTVFDDGKCWLLFVNVNTRKAYVYNMHDKGSNEVLRAMRTFKNKVGTVKGLTSDQDKAYTTPALKSFMIENSVDYRTTEDNDHNRLSIINRLIRTLRDMNGERAFTDRRLKNLVESYNDTVHSTTNMKPNDMSRSDEVDWIERKRLETEKLRDEHKLKEGTKVRVMTVSHGFHKRRFNLATDVYQVDSRQGNQYVIKARDESVATFPRHRLHPVKNGKVAATLGDKRGMVESILGYDVSKDKYRVQYVGGTSDWIPSNYMREGRPTVLSVMEREYWGQRPLPAKLRQYSP